MIHLLKNCSRGLYSAMFLLLFWPWKLSLPFYFFLFRLWILLPIISRILSIIGRILQILIVRQAIILWKFEWPTSILFENFRRLYLSNQSFPLLFLWRFLFAPYFLLFPWALVSIQWRWSSQIFFKPYSLTGLWPFKLFALINASQYLIVQILLKGVNLIILSNWTWSIHLIFPIGLASCSRIS